MPSRETVPLMDLDQLQTKGKILHACTFFLNELSKKQILVLIKKWTRQNAA